MARLAAGWPSEGHSRVCRNRVGGHSCSCQLLPVASLGRRRQSHGPFCSPGPEVGLKCSLRVQCADGGVPVAVTVCGGEPGEVGEVPRLGDGRGCRSLGGDGGQQVVVGGVQSGGAQVGARDGAQVLAEGEEQLPGGQPCGCGDLGQAQGVSEVFVDEDPRPVDGSGQGGGVFRGWVVVVEGAGKIPRRRLGGRTCVPGGLSSGAPTASVRAWLDVDEQGRPLTPPWTRRAPYSSTPTVRSPPWPADRAGDPNQHRHPPGSAEEVAESWAIRPASESSSIPRPRRPRGPPGRRRAESPATRARPSTRWDRALCAR